MPGLAASGSRIGVTSYSTPNDTEVVVTRVFNAPRDVVFDAMHNPKHLPHWLTGPEGWTMPVCEVDLRPGGQWHFLFRNTDGTEMPMRGSYREVVRPERVVSTESWGPEWPETINTTVLTEMGHQTLVTLTLTYVSKAVRDAALATGMKDGMDQSYARFDRYLVSLA